MKKVLKRSACVLLVIIVIVGALYVMRINNYIYLTQFGDTTSRQMMGYAIKTKNNEIIIIDGGTKGDSEQLKNYIVQNGGTVKAWFITHLHSDHAGAFEELYRRCRYKYRKNIYVNK